MTRFGLAFLTGVLLVASLSPFDQWWCAWFALVPLLWALRGTSLKEAAFCGLVAGAVTNYGAFHWLLELMNKFSELGPVAYLIMLVMALYQGVPMMLWAIILRLRRRPGSRIESAFNLLLCPLSYVALEFFYPIVFPWYLANSQHIQENTTGVIELGGLSLLSLAIVSVNLILARIVMPTEPESSQRNWPAPFLARGKGALAFLGVMIFGFCWSFSVVRNKQIREISRTAQNLEIGLIQPNQWIDEVSPIEGLLEYQKLSLELIESSSKTIDLLMWPESAVRTPAPQVRTSRGFSREDEIMRFPLDIEAATQATTRPPATVAEDRAPQWERLALQRGHRVPLLFGTTLQDMSPEAQGALPGGPALYNCAVLLDTMGEVAGIAPKSELMLFGETIPFSSTFPIVYQLLPLASALLPGEEAVVLDFQQARLGMMVCYEDLLPWFHYELAQKKPQVLLNLTNDAWFGKTAEAGAHLALSKLRAIEGRVWLVRSTPTGISAFVDATGQVAGEIPQDQRGAIHHSVPLLDITTGFERFGDTVAWFSLIFLLSYLGLQWKRRKAELPDG